MHTATDSSMSETGAKLGLISRKINTPWYTLHLNYNAVIVMVLVRLIICGQSP